MRHNINVHNHLMDCIVFVSMLLFFPYFLFNEFIVLVLNNSTTLHETKKGRNSPDIRHQSHIIDLYYQTFIGLRKD